MPDGIPGEAAPQRIGFYVESMSRSVKRAFAREYTTANVLRSDNFADPVLHEFLNAVPDFDYGNSSIPAVLNKTQITGESRKALEKTLKSLQRLYRVAPIEHKFPVLDTLVCGRFDFIPRHHAARQRAIHRSVCRCARWTRRSPPTFMTKRPLLRGVDQCVDRL